MDERDIVKESFPVASSTLSKERRTLMSKVVKETASLRSVSDMNFRNLTENHNFRMGGELSRKKDFELADVQHNARKDRKENHVKHYVFDSSDMNDTANALGYAMKPGALGHDFRFAPQFALSYNALSSEK